MEKGQGLSELMEKDYDEKAEDSEARLCRHLIGPCVPVTLN